MTTQPKQLMPSSKPTNLSKEKMRYKTHQIQRQVELTKKSAKLLGSVNHDPLGKVIVDYFRDVERHHGTRTAINQAKALYQESIRFSCGLKVIPVTPIWVKREKDFYPLLLKPFRSPLRGGTLERRMALSLLRVYESLELSPVPNLETVTSPSQGATGFASIISSFENFLNKSAFADLIKKSYQEERDHQLKKRKDDFHFSTKKGVRGPTCATAGLQSLAITPRISDLLSEFRSLFLKGNWKGILEENQEFFRDHKDLYNDDKTWLNTKYLGRITFVPDKGAKTRLVAIGNYWIQDCLLQLHQVIYRVLQRIPQDGTYAQNQQFERVRIASSQLPVWSYDLTAATDRFPIEPQISVLKSLHKEMGVLWEEILKELTFFYEGQELKYSVGQPMGLFSSWAVFSLTHHFTIQYCAWLENEKFPFTSYAVLGDDVAIWSPNVARRYRKILTLLDVKISESKSFEPENLSGPCVAEFAKRISDRGIEITPIAPNQQAEAWGSLWNWPSFGSWLKQHDFDLETVPVSRISELAGLRPNQYRDLCCSLYMWEVLRAPTFAGVTDGLPENFQQVCTPEGVIKLRLDLLVEQASELWSSLWELHDSEREALEIRLEGPIPDNLYFSLILDTRVSQIEELEKKLIKFIPDEFDDFSEENQEEEIPQELPQLSEIEYLPKVKLEELMDGMTRHDSKRILRNRYIRLLVKKAKAIKP